MQTSPAGLVSVIDAQMGVGGGGGRTALVWKGEDEFRLGTSNRPAGRLSTNALREKQDGTDERSTNAPPPPARMFSALSAADLRRRATVWGGGGGCTVSKQWEGVNEFSKTFAGASSNSRSFSAEGHAKGAGRSLLRCDRPASLIAAVLCWSGTVV